MIIYNLTLCKKIQIPFILFSILICLQTLNAKEYEVFTEEFAPFGYTKDGKITGLSVEIVNEILKKLSYKSKIKIRPWARAYRRTLSGPNIILFSMARNKEREASFKWVGPLVSDRVYFYKKRDSAVVVKSMMDAKKVSRILLTREFPEYNYLKKLGFNNLNETVTPVQNFKMLMRNRGELVPMGELAVSEVLKEAGIDSRKIQRTNIKLFEVNLYIAFSKDISDEEIYKWQEALDHVKSSGLYEKILKKYIIE